MSGRRAAGRPTGRPAGQVVDVLRAMLDRWPRHVEGPVVETPDSWRGLMWIGYIATMYYLISNPLVFIPAAEVSILFGSWLTILLLLVERQRLRLPVVPWSVLLFVVLAAASMAWTISKDDTWAVTRLTVVVAGLALLVTTNVSPKVLAYGMGVGGAVITALSMLAFWLELPGAATPVDVISTVAGVGTNRNILAYSLVPALGALLAIRPASRWEWPLIASLIAANVWGIWVATSGTGYLAGLLVFIAAIGLRVAVASRRVAGPWGPGTILALMAVGVGAAGFNLDRLARLVGRDLDTLSGRRPLWSAIIDVSHDRFIEGYGFGAVWNHPWHAADPNEVLQSIDVKAAFAYPHGHNSFMDLLPELGLLACLVLLLMYVQALWPAIRAVVTGASPASLEASRVVILVCLAHVALGLTEPLATVPFGWYVLVLAVGISLQIRSDRPTQVPTLPAIDSADVETQRPREVAGSPRRG